MHIAAYHVKLYFTILRFIYCISFFATKNNICKPTKEIVVLKSPSLASQASCLEFFYFSFIFSIASIWSLNSDTSHVEVKAAS